MRQFRADYWKRRLRQDKRNEEWRRLYETPETDNQRETVLGVRSRSGSIESDGLEVEVLPNRQVYIVGLEVPHIKPHLEDIRPRKESFNILTPPVEYRPGSFGEGLAMFDRNYEDPSETGRSKWTLTFGSDAGLNEYLKRFGWQHLLDKP